MSSKICTASNIKIKYVGNYQICITDLLLTDTVNFQTFFLQVAIAFHVIIFIFLIMIKAIGEWYICIFILKAPLVIQAACFGLTQMNRYLIQFLIHIDQPVLLSFGLFGLPFFIVKVYHI